MIECWGRNGFFKFDNIQVWSDYPERVYVDINSKRSGKSSPIAFQGSKQELFTLFNDILKKMDARDYSELIVFIRKVAQMDNTTNINDLIQEAKELLAEMVAERMTT